VGLASQPHFWQLQVRPSGRASILWPEGSTWIPLPSLQLTWKCWKTTFQIDWFLASVFGGVSVVIDHYRYGDSIYLSQWHVNSIHRWIACALTGNLKLWPNPGHRKHHRAFADISFTYWPLASKDDHISTSCATVSLVKSPASSSKNRCLQTRPVM
jgi:hypothetical protein